MMMMMATLVSCKGNNNTNTECVHTFQEATCEKAKTCSRCGVTEGVALQHNYVLNAQGNYFCTICKNILLIYLVKTTS